MPEGGGAVRWYAEVGYGNGRLVTSEVEHADGTGTRPGILVGTEPVVYVRIWVGPHVVVLERSGVSRREKE